MSRHPMPKWFYPLVRFVPHIYPPQVTRLVAVSHRDRQPRFSPFPNPFHIDSSENFSSLVFHSVCIPVYWPEFPLKHVPFYFSQVTPPCLQVEERLSLPFPTSGTSRFSLRQLWGLFSTVYAALPESHGKQSHSKKHPAYLFEQSVSGLFNERFALVRARRFWAMKSHCQ